MCFRGVAAFMDLFLDLGPVLECDHDTVVLADGHMIYHCQPILIPEDVRCRSSGEPATC